MKNGFIILLGLTGLILGAQICMGVADNLPYQFTPDEEQGRNKNSFSLNFWGGVFDNAHSQAETNDKLTLLKGTQKNFDRNFSAAGLNVTDIAVFPSAKSGFGKWLSAGMNLFILYGDYKVLAVSADGLSSQQSDLTSHTAAFTGYLKISPLIDSSFQPYVGFAAGPGYTSLRDTRTTIINSGSPVLDRDRVWDTSNLTEAFGGIDVYLGKSFHLNIEMSWLTLNNTHLLFPDAVTGHHTAEAKTILQGWLTTFGIGIKF